MIAIVKKFFRPETEIEQLRRIVAILSCAIAVCTVSLLLYIYELNRSPTNNPVDKIGI